MTTKLEFLQGSIIDERLEGFELQPTKHGHVTTLHTGQTVLFNVTDGAMIGISDRSSTTVGQRTDVRRYSDNDGESFLFSVSHDTRDPRDNQPGRVVRTVSGDPVARVTRIGENIGKKEYRRRTSR